jgi:hypothetical protein
MADNFSVHCIHSVEVATVNQMKKTDIAKFLDFVFVPWQKSLHVETS